jgi:hypothetical protein
LNCVKTHILAGLICCTLAGCSYVGSNAPLPSANLAVSQPALSFIATAGIGANPAAEGVNVTNTGTSMVMFTAASDSPWLLLTPASGTTPQQLQISAAPGTLAPGNYTGHVTVSPAGASGSPAIISVTFVVAPVASNSPFWQQWGANPQHTGAVGVAAQNVAHQLADIVYDPFVAQEQVDESGELLVHYQAVITDGNDVYLMMKTGTYAGPNAWNSMIWNEARFAWENGQLVQIWMFASDWKPEVNGSSLSGWEPVFHPVDANNFIYVPGAGGTVWKVNKADGTSASHINPFGGNVTPANTYTSGPLSADAQGNIYYNVIELNPANGDPWAASDVLGAWLVKIAPNDLASTISFAALVPNAPAGASSTCPGTFADEVAQRPWPPSAGAAPSLVRCGSQRPGVNVAPAIAPDGTIYTVSRAHFDSMAAYLVAVKPDLSGAKWAASLQNLLSDGCGFLVPIQGPSNSDPNSCRNGTTPGVDPATNAPGSGVIFDQASSSPTILPDGSVVFGALDNYNYDRGHLFKFDAQGNFQGAYDFGWDSTPGVYQHNGTYSIVIKDNHYRSGPYYITQLDPNLQIEWQFQSKNTESCKRNPTGPPTCVSDHPGGFEWCINMPAIDSNGTVYVNSEDGNLYSLPQGNSGIFTQASGHIFLNLALGAAYTPLSIGPDGKIYTQNDGQLFVVGN